MSAEERKRDGKKDGAVNNGSNIRKWQMEQNRQLAEAEKEWLIVSVAAGFLASANKESDKKLNRDQRAAILRRKGVM